MSLYTAAIDSITACLAPSSETQGQSVGSGGRARRKFSSTGEKNSGETVRRLGTIIQSIFCAQSGAGIRLNFGNSSVVPRGSFART